MALRTQVAPQKFEEKFDAKDRAEIHTIIRNLRHTYTERLHEAVFDLNRAQRQVNRASHEVHRIEKHLERINDFCNKNNIPLDDAEEGK